ncbi:hypothetical protein DRQ36_07565 [bacterium]|nr:MAG: hypothetical protein DRQ36_07565 [bacterium]
MTLSDINIKDPRVQKVIGGVVILFIMVGIWHMQIYGPNKEAISKKRESIEQLNLKLQTAKMNAGKLAEIQKEMEEAFVKYKLLEKLMPAERDVPDFLNKLNIASRENNVKVINIDLEPSEVREFYIADPYRIEFKGNYHDLGAFLEDIANLPFIATAKNVNLKKTDKATGTISASLTIISYHMPMKDRLMAPTQLASARGGTHEATKPRATEDDAVGAISGGLSPAPH